MTHPMEILSRGAAEMGLELTDRQMDQFGTYHVELADWNQRANLTAITERREVQVKHFLDSLTVLLAYPAGLPATTRLVDVGAGAGFPSLPLKLLYPDLRVSLVESTGKKTQFLEHLLGVLGLSGVEVWKGRAEELAHRPELREGFDLVLSRGVAKLPTLLEYTLPFCRLGGRVALLKRGVEEEIAGAARALDALGGRLDQTYPVRVTGLTDNRVVVAVDKVRSTPPEYPRRPGMPAKRPL